MPIPLSTDQYSWRTPYTTLSLVTLNAIMYAVLLMVARMDSTAAQRQWIQELGLSWQHFRGWQPFTYQFLHDPHSFWHIAGNMLFLWVFGTSVEARFRWWGFACFYLIGGAIAGMVEVLTHHSLVIGASGSVVAVTGAFIVLYPRAKVTVFMLLSTVPVPAMLLVILYLLLDVLGATGMGEGGVAHLAHLSGLVYGVTVALVLLWTGVVRRTDMDLLFLLKQARRRAEMKRVAASTQGGPWSGAATPPARVAAVTSGVKAPPPPMPVQSVHIAARQVEAGTAAFARGDFHSAAAAYERAIAAAPTASDVDQTRLMLAVIYGRKLGQPARAREFLNRVGTGLPEHMQPLHAALRVEVQA